MIVYMNIMNVVMAVIIIFKCI